MAEHIQKKLAKKTKPSQTRQMDNILKAANKAKFKARKFFDEFEKNRPSSVDDKAGINAAVKKTEKKRKTTDKKIRSDVFSTREKAAKLLNSINPKLKKKIKKKKK